jgi:hypothetical protein
VCKGRAELYAIETFCPLAGILVEEIISKYIKIPAYILGVARVFTYPNLIAICVPSLTEIAHLDGIFSITSTLLGGTLPLFPRRCPGIYLSQSYSHMCTKFD